MKFLIVIALSFLSVIQAKKINFCYYPDYGSNVVKPSNIKAEYCTHIGYSFFELGTDGTCSLKEPGWEGGIIKELITKKSPNTKICPVIGGYGRSWAFGAVASNPSARKKFVQTCGALMKQYGFDNCFDVDWEFPTQNERNSFISLLRDIKSGMAGVELFVAVSAGIWQADISYDIPALASTTDYINLMTYDYHGSWESQTGMNSALTGPPGDQLNIEATVKYYLTKGAPAKKLVIGIPFYGRTFTLTTSSNSVGAPSSGGSTIEYFNFCTDKSWSIKRDNTYKVSYAVKGNTWLSFDDEISINAKTNYVNKNGLAGTLIWSLQQDDTRGACGKGSWPLLTSVYKGLNGGNSDIPNTTTANPPTAEPTTTNTPIPPSTSLPSGGSFKCPAANGYYVDPENCSNYHYCLGGNDMGLQNCPDGLKFVPKPNGAFLCDWTSPIC